MNRKHLNYPPPQVPRTVREVLKDYPEVIEDLQDGLTKSHYGPLGALSFDSAVWLLKDMLESNWIDARREKEQAKAQGDQEVAQQAEKRRLAIGEASRLMLRDDDLSDYFQTYEKAFR